MTPEPGLPPELAWLPVGRCYVDPSYQRSLDTPRGQKLIARIAGDFSWARFGALMAAPGEPDAEGPRWLIIDGQHRHAAVQLFNELAGGGAAAIGHVPAVVHKGLSAAAQAAAFVAANRDRVAVYAQQVFRAGLVAGEPEAVTLQRLAERAQIRILSYPCSAKKLPPGSTAAVPALRTMLRLYGEERAGAAIIAVGERLRHQPAGLRAPYFIAAGLYLNGGGTADGLREALRRTDVRALERLAERQGMNSAAKAIAAALTATVPPPPAGVTKSSEIISEIITAAQEPQAAPRRGAEADGRRPAVGAAPAQAISEKVTAGGRTAASRPSSQGGRIASAGASLVPRTLSGQPSAAGKPAPRPALPASADAAAIARFLADKGARHVASPEQVAALLRDAGHAASVRIAASAGKNAHSMDLRYLDAPEYWLDGAKVPEAAFYAAANALRQQAGLPPVEPAGAAGAAA